MGLEHKNKIKTSLEKRSNNSGSICEELKKKHTAMIKAESLRLGFSGCGIAKAQRLNSEYAPLASWIAKGMNGTMSFISKSSEKRIDPALFLEGAKSVICVILNYYPRKNSLDKNFPKISCYAYGKDYHVVMKNKLSLLLEYINHTIGKVNARIAVDSSPVLEKAWAKQCGLGWTGKNSLLITPKFGSYIFLGELITDLELEYDKPMKEHCGTCTKCLQGCPTNALATPYVLDARHCISYLTIEHHNSLPSEWRNAFNGCVYGCDICQQACPYNQNLMPHNEPDFDPPEELIKMKKEDWYSLTEEKFNRIFNCSSVKRITFKQFKRNLNIIK